MNEFDEDYDIDDFEKLYAMLASQEAAKNFSDRNPMIIDENFRDEDFVQICTFAKYKKENINQFGEKTINEADANYYIIPQTKQLKVKNGAEEIIIDKKIRFFNDNLGNNLYIIWDNR